jgi:hypothetical protein
MSDPRATDEEIVRPMASAASELLGALDDQRREVAALAFGDEAARRDWHYVPRLRRGLSLADMDASQERLAYRLLASGLSLHAFAQATTIIALEDVLDVMEGGRAGRHRADYSVTVFGAPGAAGPWGWRFEGHHLSLNVTVVGGAVSSTPLFLGANPARLAHDGTVVVRPLAAEEDLARDLLGALAPPLHSLAVVSETAPDDILTGNAPRLDEEVRPRGVRGGELPADAAQLLRRLVATYLDRLPPAFAQEARDRLDAQFGEFAFAWCGKLEPGRPHYYRVQGPAFLVEYDNTQDGANHVHTVWRSPAGDFGEDLLRRHLHEHHGAARAASGGDGTG